MNVAVIRLKLTTPMKRLSLQSLLLLVGCVAIASAWYVQSSTPAEVYYLHVFSETFHPVHQEVFRYHTATIGVSPGIPFHGNFTQSEFPVTVLDGRIERQGNQFACTLNLTIDETSVVDGFSKTKIIPLETLVEFSYVHSAILSKTSDPDDLDIPLE